MTTTLGSQSNEEAARFVTGAAGRDYLGEIAGLSGDAPAHVLTLRKRGLPLEIASLLVDVAHARKRARARFGNDAARLFFTGDALGQATSPGIAAYHAARLAPLGTVADLGCGVGMDSVALARAGANVVAVEQDAARLVFACANAEAFGVTDKITFVCGDAQTADWDADAAFCDPSRRERGDGSGEPARRVSGQAGRYNPPLSFVVDVMTRRVKRGGCVKLSPALPDSVLDELNGRVEFLSENRECKEACVWFGDAFGAAQHSPRAVVFLPTQRVVPAPSEKSENADAHEPAPLAALDSPFLYDPDPALVRTGSLAALAGFLGNGAGLLSHSDAYLAGNATANKTLAQTFRVLHQMPYKPRLLGQWLRENGYHRLVIKKRFFPLEPPAVLRALGLPPRNGNNKEAVLVLVRENPKTFRAFVCEPFEP